MENTSLVDRVVDSLNHDLSVAFKEVIEKYDIKLHLDNNSTKTRDTSIVIFVNNKTPKPKTSKKNKKLKQFDLSFAYSLYLNFDLSNLIGHDVEPIKLQFLYMHTKPECFQPMYNRILYWSKPLFKKVYETFEEYGIYLSTLPYEIYADENDELHISRLPTFNDLIFFDKTDPSKTLDKSLFIEEQAKSLSAAIDSFENSKSNNKH